MPAGEECEVDAGAHFGGGSAGGNVNMDVDVDTDVDGVVDVKVMVDETGCIVDVIAEWKCLGVLEKNKERKGEGETEGRGPFTCMITARLGQRGVRRKLSRSQDDDEALRPT